MRAIERSILFLPNSGYICLFFSFQANLKIGMILKGGLLSIPLIQKSKISWFLAIILLPAEWRMNSNMSITMQLLKTEMDN